MEDETGIMYKLGGIEAYLKSISDKLDKSIKDNEDNHKDHEARLKKLEAGQVRIYTLATGAGVLAALLSDLGIKWVSG